MTSTAWARSPTSCLSRYPPHHPNFDAQRVQEEPVPPLVPVQQIPPQLANLVAAMLAKDPNKRPANMRDVIDELDASLNDTLTFDFDTDLARARRMRRCPRTSA